MLDIAVACLLLLLSGIDTASEQEVACVAVRLKCNSRFQCYYRYALANGAVNPCGNEITAWTSVSGIGGESTQFYVPPNSSLEIAPPNWQSGYDFVVVRTGIMRCGGDIVSWLWMGATACEWHESLRIDELQLSNSTVNPVTVPEPACVGVRLQCLAKFDCAFRWSNSNTVDENPCSKDMNKAWTSIAGIRGESEEFLMPPNSIIEVAPEKWHSGWNFLVKRGGYVECWGDLETWSDDAAEMCKWHGAVDDGEGHDVDLSTDVLAIADRISSRIRQVRLCRVDPQASPTDRRLYGSADHPPGDAEDLDRLAALSEKNRAWLLNATVEMVDVMHCEETDKCAVEPCSAKFDSILSRFAIFEGPSCVGVHVRCLATFECSFRWSDTNTLAENPCGKEINAWTRLPGLRSESGQFSMPPNTTLEVAPAGWKTGEKLVVVGGGYVECWGDIKTWKNTWKRYGSDLCRWRGTTDECEGETVDASTDAKAIAAIGSNASGIINIFVVGCENRIAKRLRLVAFCRHPEYPDPDEDEDVARLVAIPDEDRNWIMNSTRLLVDGWHCDRPDRCQERSCARLFQSITNRMINAKAKETSTVEDSEGGPGKTPDDSVTDAGPEHNEDEEEANVTSNGFVIPDTDEGLQTLLDDPKYQPTDLQFHKNKVMVDVMCVSCCSARDAKKMRNYKGWNWLTDSAGNFVRIAGVWALENICGYDLNNPSRHNNVLLTGVPDEFEEERQLALNAACRRRYNVHMAWAQPYHRRYWMVFKSGSLEQGLTYTGRWVQPGEYAVYGHLMWYWMTPIGRNFMNDFNRSYFYRAPEKIPFLRQATNNCTSDEWVWYWGMDGN